MDYKNSIVLRALTNAVAAALYVFLVALFMTNAQNIFGNQPDGVLAPTIVLLLLVVSAAVMGIVIFGLPIMWYLDGKKREAVQLTLWTVGLLALILIDVVFSFAVMI
jgi:hypothetical protein